MPFETPSPALARVRKGENERKTGDLSVRSPFRRSAEHTLETFRKLGELEETMPDLDRPATVAEEFGNRQMLHLMRLRLLGTFLRMLDAEIAAGNLTPAVREQ